MTLLVAIPAPMDAMTSMAQTKTIPLLRCSLPPLRVESATPPAVSASSPEMMCRSVTSSHHQHLDVGVPHHLQDEVVDRGLTRLVGDADELGIPRNAGLRERVPDLVGRFGRSIGFQ